MHYRRLQEDAKKSLGAYRVMFYLNVLRIKEELPSSTVIEIAPQEFVELEKK